MLPDHYGWSMPPVPRRGGVAVHHDVMALAAVVAMAVAALVSGLQVGYHQLDVDEAVYVSTARLMRHEHLSYYRAMATALVAKDKAPPRLVRALRPPTEFLVLRWLPEGAWRWLAGLLGLASLLAVWRLARPFGPWAGMIGAALAGLWLLAAMPLLFLHAELWGLPWFLAGLVALRRGRDGRAAALMVVAVAFRELYVLGLVLAAVLRRRPAWVVALLAVAGLALVHVALARHVLVANGFNARIGNERHDLHFALRLLGPGDGVLSWAIGIPTIGLGLVGAARAARRMPEAAVVAISSVVLAVAAFVATRTYWALTFAPALMAFVPASVRS
jgi:hypothetical protein